MATSTTQKNTQKQSFPTFPFEEIHLAVIGTSFAVSTIATSFGQFVLYGLGMGMVIIGLTVGMAIFKGAMVGALRKALPYIAPVGTWMMILAGSYIIFYWLTIGELLL